MKTDLNYCIVLSSEQLAYLAGSKYGIDRMKILHRLIEAAVLEETDYAIKGFSTTLQVGQAILSEVDLSCKLGYDKKTISRVLNKMNQLGIVASTQNNRTSVHTLKCISAWMENGNRIDNPFYVRIKNRQEEGENTGALSNDAKPPAPQIRLIIRLLQDLHPEIHPKIKSDSLIIILYIKHYLQVLNNLTIMMPCGILLYFLLFCLFLSNKYVTLKYHFGLDWN